ncbi:MAG: ABC transporter permease [Deltaproteobacteria bacterium]|nr:ABC transporter permease [Deltaproteobacteria bacterium]
MVRVRLLLAAIGGAALQAVRETGGLFLFFLHGVFHIVTPPFRPRRVIEQVYFIGARSVLVVALTSAFTGMVLGLQGYYTLVKFGAEGLLGAAVALALIREMGPVLTAIMITARAGSAAAAEIGVMRVSEEIDALETMDIDPVHFLVAPRLAAAAISFPLLTAMFDLVGIVGGWLSGSVLLGVSGGTYFSRVESSVTLADVRGGFIKAFVFALVVSTVCCFQGYFTHTRRDGHGARGVGLSTTRAVVTSCVLILVADYVLTSFLL